MILEPGARRDAEGSIGRGRRYDDLAVARLRVIDLRVEIEKRNVGLRETIAERVFASTSLLKRVPEPLVPLLAKR
jgi:hypothetical protein